MSAERRKGVYMISAVAELYGVHPQTLRLYEREGLLRPSRTQGNTRVYTDADLEQLQTIRNLRELGVNLAGVEIILNMRKKMQQMQEEIARFTEFIQQELARQDPVVTERARNALVRLPRQEIVRAGRAAEALPRASRDPESSREREVARAGLRQSSG